MSTVVSKNAPILVRTKNLISLLRMLKDNLQNARSLSHFVQQEYAFMSTSVRFNSVQEELIRTTLANLTKLEISMEGLYEDQSLKLFPEEKVDGQK